MSDETRDLTKKTVENVAWNYLAFASGKLVTFISTTLLARILSPEDFGLLAIALLVIGYLDVFSTLGVGYGVVYMDDDEDRPGHVANVAIVISVVSALFLMALTMFAAPFVARFFNEVRVVPLLRALSITMLISSFGAVHYSKLVKALNFRDQIKPMLSKAIVKGVVSIAMALMGFGVWSLVWGQIAGTIASVGVMWWVVKWTPLPAIDLRIMRQLTGLGWQIIMVDLFGQIIKNIDYFIIARKMVSEQLGYYTLAYRLPELAIISIVSVVSQALFPSFTKVKDDIVSLQQGFLAVLRYISAVTIPLGLGILVITPEFINVFYTEKWEDTIRVMQVLALYAVVFALSYNAGAVYKGTGRPGILNQLAVIKIIISVPVLWFAANYTIYHVALGQLFTTIIVTLISFAFVIRIVHIKPHDIARAILPSAGCGLIMLVVLYALKLQIALLSDIATIGILIPVGMLTYIAAIYLLNRRIITDTIELFDLRQRMDKLKRVGINLGGD